MQDTNKAAVLGDVDFVLPFSALGLDTYAVDSSTEKIIAAATEIIENNYSFVVVAENIAAIADGVFSAVANKAVPCIVVVPFTTEPSGFATRALSDVLKMATGIDIMQDN